MTEYSFITLPFGKALKLLLGKDKYPPIAGPKTKPKLYAPNENDIAMD